MSQAQATYVMAPWEFAVSHAMERAIDMMRFLPSTPRQIGSGKRTLNTLRRRAHGHIYKPNSPREIARRVRQIAAGALRAENGVA